MKFPHHFESIYSIYNKYIKGKGLDIGASGSSIQLNFPKAAIDTQDIRKLGHNSLTYWCPVDLIPAPPNSYDFIYASHVIEHLNNPLKTLQKLARLLKPKGKLIMVMPDCRLYITDRKRFNIEERRGQFFATIDILKEDLANNVRNHPRDWKHEKPHHLPYYYEHKYLWTVGMACDALRHSGFKIREFRESSENFITVFDKELLPHYVDKLFLPPDAGRFCKDIEMLQMKHRAPLLNYSFIVIADKM